MTWLDRLNRSGVIAASIALIALVTAIDWIAPAALAIPILYLLPVMLVTYGMGRRSGLAVSLLCGGLYLVTSTVSHADSLSAPIAIWNCIARTVGLIVVAELQGGLHAALRREQQVARTDGLTGVHNRRHFYELIDRELDRLRRYGQPFSLLYLDVDRFKQVNDRFGHHAGDRVLWMVCDLLRSTPGSGVRTTDSIGRLGGDEFAVLLPCTTAEDADRLVARIQPAIDRRLAQWGAGVSIGCATATTGLTNADELVAAADRAMYQAKTKAKEALPWRS